MLFIEITIVDDTKSTGVLLKGMYRLDDPVYISLPRPLEGVSGCILDENDSSRRIIQGIHIVPKIHKEKTNV